jgi:hypothetical protein
MYTRTRLETITFENEFSLDGIEQMQAPGIYVVEIEEELIMDLSFPAYRRMATMIRLFRPLCGGGYEAATIDSRDLEAALERDAVLTSNFCSARQTRDSQTATNASWADSPSSAAFSSAFSERFRKAAARLRLKNNSHV